MSKTLLWADTLQESVATYPPSWMILLFQLSSMIPHHTQPAVAFADHAGTHMAVMAFASSLAGSSAKVSRRWDSHAPFRRKALLRTFQPSRNEWSLGRGWCQWLWFHTSTATGFGRWCISMHFSLPPSNGTLGFFFPNSYNYTSAGVGWQSIFRCEPVAGTREPASMTLGVSLAGERLSARSSWTSKQTKPKYNRKFCTKAELQHTTTVSRTVQWTSGHWIGNPALPPIPIDQNNGHHKPQSSSVDHSEGLCCTDNGQGLGLLKQERGPKRMRGLQLYPPSNMVGWKLEVSWGF